MTKPQQTESLQWNPRIPKKVFNLNFGGNSVHFYHGQTYEPWAEFSTLEAGHAMQG